MKKYIELLFLGMLVLLLFSCQAKESCDQTEVVDVSYKIQDISTGFQQKFQYEIYNTNGEIMDSGTVKNAEPRITHVAESIVKLSVPFGTNAVQCTYYNVAENKISEVFQNPIIENDEVVAYFFTENNRKWLIIHWLFEDRQKEYSVNFSGAYGQVENAEISDRILSVTYVVGDDCELKTESFPF